MLSLATSQALLLSLKLSAVTTLLLLLLGTPLAWWLARSRGRLATLVEALVALPLVLPPTVIGFYLLVAFAPDSLLGGAWQRLTGTSVAFSFSGLVLGSVIYSLPFVVQPLASGFRALDRRLLEAARLLGAGPLDRFLHVAVPLCGPAFTTAAVLGFAHTLGEFGVVLMIGGNIPGETRVLSIALYDRVEMLAYGEAHRIAALLLVSSLALLLLVYRQRRPHRELITP